jgi:hypothetical protein
LIRKLKVKLRGDWNYYGIIGNSQSLNQYDRQVKGRLYKWLNRQSQKWSFAWHSLYRLLKRLEIPPPQIVEQIRQRLVGLSQMVWKIGQAIAVDLYGAHYHAARA